jgi:hypothetical protein
MSDVDLSIEDDGFMWWLVGETNKGLLEHPIVRMLAEGDKKQEVK